MPVYTGPQLPHIDWPSISRATSSGRPSEHRSPLGHWNAPCSESLEIENSVSELVFNSDSYPKKPEIVSEKKAMENMIETIANEILISLTSIYQNK